MAPRRSGNGRLALLAHAGLAGGVVLFTALIAWEGVRAVAWTLASAGTGLLWVTLFHLAPLTASALGWYTLFGPTTRPAFRTFGWARWIAESINQLLPALHVGGNIVRAQLLARRGVPGAVAGGSVVVDITLHLTGQLLFTTLGLCLLLAHVGGGALARPVVFGLLTMALTIAGLLAVQHRGIFGTMSRLIARIVRSHEGSALSSNADALDAAVRGFYADRRRLGTSSVWHLLSWLLGAGEIWLALRFLGHPVGLATAVVIESLGEALRTAAFTVPGALGVQEGGFVLLGRLFGFTPEVAIALSLAKRVREVALGVPGLVVWQVQGLSALVGARGGRLLDHAARRLVSLTPESLLAAARRRTRLEDFGAPAFREPLGRLLASIEGEARLSPIGRIAARHDLTGMLVNRLLIERDRRRHPEIAAEEVRRPLVITGLPRTGSTFLHGLLAQDPANRTPRHWELRSPSPPPERTTYDTDPRIARAARDIRWFVRLAPRFPAIHPVGARLPEECVVILSHAFLSFQFSSMWFVPSYQRWLDSADLAPAYGYHRRFLQHLQWRCRGERWLLKAPPHLRGLPALFATYPDANVVMTHRDPVEVVASVTSLHVVLRQAFSRHVDPLRVGPEVATMLADDIRCGVEARANGCAPAERFFDVWYTELVADPLAVVRRIYRHFDLPLSDAAVRAMRHYLASRPQDGHGRHVYALADFGLDAERERERNRAYLERFGRGRDGNAVA